jgi:uncharacterized membrane protein required for colicin V production
MNIIDLALWAVLGVSIVFGLYSGLLGSLLNSVGMLFSYMFAWWFYKPVATWVQGHEDWVGQLIHYTEGAARIPSLELARSSISSLDSATIASTVEQARFPFPFGKLLLSNIESAALAHEGALTLGEYFNTTIVEVSINLLSFALLFALMYIGFSIAIAATNYVVKLPVLRTMDWLAGGVIGLARGVMLALVAVSLLPVVLSALPGGVPLIDDILGGSSMLPFFLDSNPILDGIRGVI